MNLLTQTPESRLKSRALLAISSTGVFLLCQPLIKTEMSYKRETVGDAQLERIRSRARRLDPSSTFFLGVRKKLFITTTSGF